MSGKQAEILDRLKRMKKELAKKEKKLKKCARASSAKEYVKRRLREQQALDGTTLSPGVPIGSPVKPNLVCSKINTQVNLGISAKPSLHNQTFNVSLHRTVNPTHQHPRASPVVTAGCTDNRNPPHSSKSPRVNVLSSPKSTNSSQPAPSSRATLGCLVNTNPSCRLSSPRIPPICQPNYQHTVPGLSVIVESPANTSSQSVTSDLDFRTSSPSNEVHSSNFRTDHVDCNAESRQILYSDKNSAQNKRCVRSRAKLSMTEHVIGHKYVDLDENICADNGVIDVREERETVQNAADPAQCLSNLTPHWHYDDSIQKGICEGDEEKLLFGNPCGTKIICTDERLNTNTTEQIDNHRKTTTVRDDHVTTDTSSHIPLGSRSESDSDKLSGSQSQYNFNKFSESQSESNSDKLSGSRSKSNSDKLSGSLSESISDKLSGLRSESNSDKLLESWSESNLDKLSRSRSESSSDKLAGSQSESNFNKLAGLLPESSSDKLSGSLSHSNSDKLSMSNSSGEVTSSTEHQSRKSLSLKRKRNVSKCHQPVITEVRTESTGQVIGDRSMADSENRRFSAVNHKQVTDSSGSSQCGHTCNTDKPQVKTKVPKKRRRSQGRMLDVDLEKEINSVTDSESTQNSEEFETLLLIQQSYRPGVDYATRHGKTHNLPSMLSSIFQYFIDEHKRKKDQIDFYLPEDQFGKIMRKRVKMTEENSLDDSVRNLSFDQYTDSSVNLDSQIITIESPEMDNGRDEVTSCDIYHYDNVEKSPCRTNLNVTENDCSEKESSCTTTSGSPHLNICSDIRIVQRDEGSEINLEPRTKKITNGALSQDYNTSALLKESESPLNTPKHTEQRSICDDVTLSPALFGSPQQSIETEDSMSVSTDSLGDSQGSLVNTTQRSSKTKGEKLQHVGCIKVPHLEPLSCVAACCIQIGCRRTDVVLCVGQSRIGLWNQTGSTYTCVHTWPLDQVYHGVECYTYPAVFRDMFCYFVVVMHRDDGESRVKVVHYNAGTDKAQLVYCVHSNSVRACCVSVEDFFVSQTSQSRTNLTKYSVDCDGQLIPRQVFDPCLTSEATPKCLRAVEELLSALGIWFSDNSIALWNTDSGTIVWTCDLSLTWPEPSTMVTARWEQDYLLVCVVSDQKTEHAGGLLIINPETDASTVLVHYTMADWKGQTRLGRLDDSIVATDQAGTTCMWDLYSGQLCYHGNASTGVTGLGQYWRKLITMYKHCVHIFR